MSTPAPPSTEPKTPPVTSAETPTRVRQSVAETKKPWWKFWSSEDEQAQKPVATERSAASVKKLSAVVMPNTVPSPDQPIRQVNEPQKKGGSSALLPKNADRAVRPATEAGSHQVAVAMTSLSTTQERLNSAISTLSAHMQSSAARDEKVLTSLSNIDNTMNKASVMIENSAIRSENALDRVGDHLDLSSEKLETIAAHFDETERERLATFERMQKRSNAVLIFLGVALVIVAIIAIMLAR